MVDDGRGVFSEDLLKRHIINRWAVLLAASVLSLAAPRLSAQSAAKILCALLLSAR